MSEGERGTRKRNSVTPMTDRGSGLRGDEQGAGPRDDDSDESPTVSPRTDDDSSCMTSDDSDLSSVAVACPQPTEIIVKGSKIRMKFHPHPPSQAGVSKPSSRKRHPHRHGGRGASPDRLPLSTEESSLPDMRHWSLPSPEEEGACAAAAHPRDSGVYSAAGRADEETCVFRQVAATVHEDAGRLSELDRAARDDILRGLDYFEGRTERSRDTIAHMRAELERLLETNRRLENVNARLENDTVMQQQRLDTLLKDNERLKEQALDQWNARIKADEMLAETRRDLEREVRQLREQITSNGDANAESEARQLAVEKQDLQRKINNMESEIAKLVCEKRNSDEYTSSLKEEATNAKVRLSEVKTELSNQLKRFVALKRSYNKLLEENETIKSQLRGRVSLANETWPVRSNSKTLAGLEDSERVRLINLNLVERPAQRAAPGHLSLPKPDPSTTLVSPGRKLPPVPR